MKEDISRLRAAEKNSRLRFCHFVFLGSFNWGAASRRFAVGSVLALGLIITPQSIAAPPKASIALRLVPANVVNRQSSELLVTIDSEAEVQDASLSLKITAPPCFSSNPPASDLPAFSRNVIVTAIITAAGCDPAAQELPIIVDLSAKGPPSRTLASQSITFTYAKRIALSLYLLIGCVGIALGYLLRLLVKALAATTPPPLAPANPEQVAKIGPIGKFVNNHYYWTDFMVTVLLGFLALLYLVHSGSPPDSASQWYGALILGVSFGALTNSELITKLGRP